MNWHIASFALVIAVGKELTHEFLESESTLLKYSRFPVLGENYVVGRQCGGRANGDAFLSRRNLRNVSHSIQRVPALGFTHHVETQAALPLRIEHDQVHNAHFHTPII